MKFNKIKLLIFVIGLLVFISFSVSAVNYGGTLKIKNNLRPITLNPIYAEDKTALKVNKQIFEGLISYDENGNIIPLLAESWEISSDASSFIFNLKDNIYFQSMSKNSDLSKNQGREVRAEDWKFSFEYLADPDNKSSYAHLLEKVKGYQGFRSGNNSEITGIKVLDPYRLKIELEEAYYPFIYHLLEPALVVMPKEDLKSEDKNFALNPVGTGAFYLKEYKNDKILLEKNANYWQNDSSSNQLPYLEQIEFNFKEFGLLNKKDISYFDLYQLNQNNYLTYKKNQAEYLNYSLIKIPGEQLYFYGFNYKSNLIKNDRNYSDFKKAVNKALNKNKLVEDLNLYNYSALNEIEQNFTKIGKILNLDNFNLNSAEELLNKFNDKKLKLSLNNSSESVEIAEKVRMELNNFGVEIELDSKNWAEHLNDLRNNNSSSDLFMMSYQYQNKYDFLYDNFYSKSNKNYFNFSNNRVDNLIDYLKLEINKNPQEHAFNLIEEILIEEYPALYLFQAAESYLISDKVNNAQIFNNIYLKDNYKLLFLE